MEQINIGEAIDNRKRKKRPHDSVSTLRKTNKAKRMAGIEYLGFSRTTAKKMKQNVERECRKMGPSCESIYCKKRNNRHCELFDEETRCKINESFWKLDWHEKHIFVQSLARAIPIRRSHVEGSRKKQGFKFCLYLKGEVQQVCRNMFLSTLGLKRAMVYGWLRKTSESLFGMAATKPNPEKKIKSSAWAVAQEDRKKHLILYLQNLEKMESHYCRVDTGMLYLTSSFFTKAQLYRKYQKTCKEENYQFVSYFTFAAAFDKLRLSLFVPRKDLCDTCVSYSVLQVSKEEYDAHIAEKKRAKKEKKFDKKAAAFSGRYVFTMDVQAVKLCPNINASAIYYKQRLQVHNFTFYNLFSHQCTAYWWNETEGDLSASSFTSCIIHHLELYCCGDTLPVTLYSDGCGYQNRNQFLSNALSNFAIKHNKIIEQKFLIKGHTQMECDSVHAKIEIKLENRPIYIPEDYLNVTKEARETVIVNGVTEQKPIDVEYLRYNFFKNYAETDILRFKSIRPGTKPFDPTVNEIRAIIYTPNGDIQYKLDFDDEYRDMPRSIQPYNENLTPNPLHKSTIKIKEGKWEHLQSLKAVIPIEHHSFYDNLKFIKNPRSVTKVMTKSVTKVMTKSKAKLPKSSTKVTKIIPKSVNKSVAKKVPTSANKSVSKKCQNPGQKSCQNP